MTYTSCIRQPESSRFIQLHEWQVKFCQKNHCAAFLLSFFSSWHDWKIKHDEYYRRYNDIAEAHGDGRPHAESAYLFFTMDDFINALMGLFGKKSISEGLDLLVSLNVISIHKNPNPRYCFDKTKYFKFYPAVCNQWLQNHDSINQSAENDTQVIDNYDNAEIDNRSAKNALPSSENRRPSRKNGQAITDNTNNTTNKNKSINTPTNFDQPILNPNPEVQSIITALTEKGMQSKRFFPDAIDEIHRLQRAGATLEMFIHAYDVSAEVTRGNSFGIGYLAKVINGFFEKTKSERYQQNNLSHHAKDHFANTVYESDTRNA
jgi:hypothetical protein